MKNLHITKGKGKATRNNPNKPIAGKSIGGSSPRMVTDGAHLGHGFKGLGSQLGQAKLPPKKHS